MVKEIFKYVKVIIFSVLLISIICFVISGNTQNQKQVESLVIFGQNTDLDDAHKAFVEDDCVYVAFSTFYKTVDPDLFYDNLTEKAIITNENQVVKLKLNSNIITVNLKEQSIAHPLKKVGNVVFLPLTDILPFYDICMSYNKESGIVSIDSKETNYSKVNYNKTLVYEDIKTDSNVLQTLNKNEDIVVYEDALNHNRWYKVRTMSGNIGYVFKKSVVLASDISSLDDEIKQDEKKYVMFWQYGSALDGLGEKIEGVNVVSPTVYEISNEVGDVTGKITNGYVSKAHGYGYEVWPIITNGIDNANYSSATTSTVLNSEIARENLIKNIVGVIERDNLDGINIDFEQMKDEDRDYFTQFIRELAPLMREKGKILSVDTYFVKYIDRTRVGEAADYVVLMGYDQNGAWSEVSGSVASVEWVENNIISMMEDSKIPASKIILGVPFYTRLWTEKKGTDKPVTAIYTMLQASSYINKNRLSLSYDEKTRQNYFEYTKGNNTYKMWVEDATSMKNRVDIINKYNLAGISAWRKGFETSDIWPTIIQNLEK